MDNGVSHYLDSAKRQVEAIKILFPKVRIIYKLIDIRRIFRNNVIHKLEDNFIKDNFSSLLTSFLNHLFFSIFLLSSFF